MIPAFITRPEGEGESLAEALKALGYTPILEPMFTICRTEVTLAPFPFQACLITSKQAAYIFKQYPFLQTLPVVAVGEKTAEALQRHGCTHVIVSGSDAMDLIAWVKTHLSPKEGPLLYLSGNITSHPLKALLNAEGFEVHHKVVYEAIAVETLPSGIRRCLEEKKPAIALFYSKRTAELFMEYVLRSHHQAALKQWVGYGLSTVIGEALQPLFWKSVAIAETPTEDALIEAIRRRS